MVRNPMRVVHARESLDHPSSSRRQGINANGYRPEVTWKLPIILPHQDPSFKQPGE